MAREVLSLNKHTCWGLELTFGSIKKWFSGMTMRYMGLNKTQAQHVLQAMVYHLKRSSGIMLPNSL